MNNQTLETLHKAIASIDSTGDDPLYKCLMTISASLVGVVHELGLIRTVMYQYYEKAIKEKEVG